MLIRGPVVDKLAAVEKVGADVFGRFASQRAALELESWRRQLFTPAEEGPGRTSCSALGSTRRTFGGDGTYISVEVLKPT